MKFDYLDRYLDSFYNDKGIPGVGISVYRHGKLLHQYCTGYANVENKKPFATDTLVNLYSCSKITTAAAGMTLVEKKLLDLDAPAYDYLPEMKDVTVRDGDGNVVPAKKTMLVRHLFSMSAGFSYDSDPAASKKLFEETNGAPTLRQVVKCLAGQPLQFEPGTHFRYSFCHDVLGGLIEAASGKKFSLYLKENIFDPIGMKDTEFKINDAQRPRMAPEYHGFDPKTGTARQVIYKEGLDMDFGVNMESGGGGLISCVDDYGKLAATLANGGVAPNGERILSPETIDLMRQNQLDETALRDFAAFGGWSKDGYGYGLGVRTLMNRERNNSLSENGEFGWDGALGCYLVADPKTGIGIFYAQQVGGVPFWNWHGAVKNQAYACVVADE